MKRIFTLILALVLCLPLCACGINKEEAIGTWAGTYVYNGNEYAVTFALSGGGEYVEVMYKNGALHKTEKGTWEISGGKVVLHENGNEGISTTYKYKGKALVNNDHEFFKVEK